MSGISPTQKAVLRAVGLETLRTEVIKATVGGRGGVTQAINALHRKGLLVEVRPNVWRRA